MFKLFQLLFIRNFSSVFTLFLVLILASTGFLVMRELTENIELLVAKETAPLFGADIIIGSPGYQSTPIIDRVRPILSDASYVWAERKTFSTTLFDQVGKTGLIKVIAFAGTYPQK